MSIQTFHHEKRTLFSYMIPHYGAVNTYGSKELQRNSIASDSGVRVKGPAFESITKTLLKKFMGFATLFELVAKYNLHEATRKYEK